MSEREVRRTSEAESMEVAESAREKEWVSASFLKELFLGSFRLGLIHPAPQAPPPRPEFLAFHSALKAFLSEEVDPAAIDATGEYPAEVIDGLRRLGAFGMKIPREYGGLGFTQSEYDTVMELLGTVDGNITALLSAHQSIGVPQPIKMFGTEDQKKRFLPRCARGAISAFALTEPDVGSDPATLSTTCVPDPSGGGWVLDGTKLWTTNGTLAELLVVMARSPDTNRISAFVVEASWPGVTVEHRCRFMGLRAISNALIRFREVRVPRENLIGQEGRGLKIALVTLNTGRLSLPAAAVGTSKSLLEVCRRWCNERVQWGHPIGRHEAVAHMLADMAATTFAMDALSDLADRLADRGGYDIRLEAAAAKLWNTERGWRLIDDAMQIRGGRGYETEQSLAGRGETPIGVERAMRDARINRIFEGSSEIMHLFMAREAVDRHLQVAGAVIDPRKGTGAKLAALPRIAAFYALWYPGRWLGWGRWPRFGEFGQLAGHVRFVDRACRKLARQTFHGMLVHRAALQRRQAFLFRIVDVGLELFAMSAVLTRAQEMAARRHPHAAEATELADLHCRNARRQVRVLFGALWRNDDAFKYRVAQRVLRGEHAWLSEGIIGLGGPSPAAPVPGREPEPGRAHVDVQTS
ncbi:MAG: acyl-CoA dehydrogenase family protein [Planctomycetes bacterium]|nr:acyl-CoA dehydrogenase family protein [Planctomycetota bacterium]